jgi:immune inhibitor A
MALLAQPHQAYDSTFTLDPTDGSNIHHNSVLSPVPSLPAVKAFDDRTLHYDATNCSGSVIHPNTGTIVEVRSISALDSFMQVQVRPAK